MIPLTSINLPPRPSLLYNECTQAPILLSKIWSGSHPSLPLFKTLPPPLSYVGSPPKTPMILLTRKVTNKSVLPSPESICCCSILKVRDWTDGFVYPRYFGTLSGSDSSSKTALCVGVGTPLPAFCPPTPGGVPTGAFGETGALKERFPVSVVL